MSMGGMHSDGSGPDGARPGDPRPRLSATFGPVIERGGPDGAMSAEEALRSLSRMGYAAVQWPATLAGLRPRDLDGSARRGIVSTLRRLELASSGVDAWIPPGHFLDPTTIDRAVTAIELAIRLAADLAPSMPHSFGTSAAGADRAWRPNVSILVPRTGVAAEPAAKAANVPEEKLAGQVGDALAQLATHADRLGVALTDHALVPLDAPLASGLAFGVDPALLIAAGRDPAAEVMRLGSRVGAARLVDSFRSGMRGPILEPGESRLDVLAYRVALDMIEFRAPLVVDARQWREPMQGLEATLLRWTEVGLGRGFVARTSREGS